MRNKLVFSILTSIILGLWSPVSSYETTLGGCMRFLPYDSSSGTRLLRTAAGTETTSTTGGYIGAAVDYIMLSYAHPFSETVSIQLDQTYTSDTRSTPRFGSDINAQRNTSASLFNGQNWENAKIIYRLPGGCLLSTGIMRLKLTWDYGDFLSWKDSIMETKFSSLADNAVSDSGLELKKSFEVSGIKLPATVQIVNGASNHLDTNQNIGWLVKLEPEAMGVKWGMTYFNNRRSNGVDDDIRYSLGAEVTHGPIYFRSECLASFQANGRSIQQTASVTSKNAYTSAKTSSTDLARTTGYNAVLKYSLSDQLNLIANYACVWINNINGGYAFNADDARETYIDFACSLQYYLDRNIMIMCTLENSNYTRNDSLLPTNIKDGGTYAYENLAFNRLILGTRISF
ncbi:MAG: hypothetical protein AABZ14_01155 [Candidatus Margulisiibacteriota bacterium]